MLGLSGGTTPRANTSSAFSQRGGSGSRRPVSSRPRNASSATSSTVQNVQGMGRASGAAPAPTPRATSRKASPGRTAAASRGRSQPARSRSITRPSFTSLSRAKGAKARRIAESDSSGSFPNWRTGRTTVALHSPVATSNSRAATW